MATKFGLPYFLEDKTGRLTNSEFVDLYERMKLVYRCKVRDAAHEVYEIFDITAGTYDAFHVPVITLNFGAEHILGTISLGTSGLSTPMSRYLSQVNIIGGSKFRRFVASDSNEYRWGYRLGDGNEWTCTNSSGTIVAHYNLKNPGEPPYLGSSGCMLTVEEDFGHLASEMLATVMIMRHIVAYDL